MVRLLRYELLVTLIVQRSHETRSLKFLHSTHSRYYCQRISLICNGSVCMISQMKPLISPIAQSAESVLESVKTTNVT